MQGAVAKVTAHDIAVSTYLFELHVKHDLYCEIIFQSRGTSLFTPI